MATRADTPLTVKIIFAALWLSLPVLRVEINRVIIFDAVFISLSLWLIASYLQQFRFQVHRHEKTITVGWAMMIGAAIISGLNVLNVTNWIVDVVPMIYSCALVFILRRFVGHRWKDWVEIGGKCSSIMHMIAGAVATYGLAFNTRVPFFYPDSTKTTFETTVKFSGFARATNQWGTYIVVTLPFILYGIFTTKNPLWRAFFASSIILSGMSGLATGGKTAPTLMIAQTIVFTLLVTTVGTTKGYASRSALLAGFVGLGAATITVIVRSLSSVWTVSRSLEGFDFVSGDREVTRDWRMTNWSWALEKVEQHPFIGVGLANFQEYYSRNEVHSSYLSQWAETGPIGLIGYIVVMLTPLVMLTFYFLQHKPRLDAAKRAALIAAAAAVAGALGLGVTYNMVRTRAVYIGLATALILVVPARDRFLGQDNS